MNNTINSLRFCFLALTLLALAAGCTTSPSIATSADPQINYQNYRTFTVVRARTPSNPQVTPELIRQVNESTASAFRNKGLTEVADGPADLLILPHGMIETRTDITDWGFTYGRFQRWGGYGMGVGGPYQLREYKEGTLLIDVIDGRTKELVWRGSAQAELAGAPDINRIRPAIDQIVSHYPMSTNSGRM